MEPNVPNQYRKLHSLRAYLYLGLVGISLTFALTGYGLRLYVEARISEQAMGTAWIPRNPRPIGDPAQVREILALAA